MTLIAHSLCSFFSHRFWSCSIKKGRMFRRGVIGVNAKMRFLAQTKGRTEKERERKRKGKEEEGKGRGRERKRRERRKGKGNWKWSFGRNGKNRKCPSRESNPGPQQTRLMLYHWATETSDITSQFVWNFIRSASTSQHGHHPMPISMPISFPFLFLSLFFSLRPFVCAKRCYIVAKLTVATEIVFFFFCSLTAHALLSTLQLSQLKKIVFVHFSQLHAVGLSPILHAVGILWEHSLTLLSRFFSTFWPG